MAKRKFAQEDDLSQATTCAPPSQTHAGSMSQTSLGVAAKEEHWEEWDDEPFQDEVYSESLAAQETTATGEELRGGFRDLSQEEQDLFLKVPAYLMDEIGIRNLNPTTYRGPIKKLLQYFFSRYRQSAEDDYFFETEETVRGRMWISKLVTPSFYNRTFWGHAMPTVQLAEASACVQFFTDGAVVAAGKKLPPTVKQVRRFVNHKVGNRERKLDMIRRGINPKLVVQEAIQEIFLYFKSIGCRTALWDNNI